MISPKRYDISSELGEISTWAYAAEAGGRAVYNSGASFFEKTASREKFKSSRYKELALDFAADMSTRQAAKRLNRMRLEDNGVSPTSYRNLVEREGAALQERMRQKCEEMMECNGFSRDDGLAEGTVFAPGSQEHIVQPVIENAAIKLRIWEYDASEYELARDTVNISIDDVCVKRQTQMRPENGEAAQAKRVDNTVIHVEAKGKSYILNEVSVMAGLKQLIGFLLMNGLLHSKLVIFADGAKEIHNAVNKMLDFADCKVILDWYHLEKKCKEQLSMALKGRKIRNEFLEELLPCLWFGNIRGAVRQLENIEPKKVKNAEYIARLTEYLLRVEVNVPCYALRKELGLRNSSNMGEKANDLVVANRQKHNGMSWSDEGSSAFATIAAAAHNQELNRWIHYGDINFTLHQKAA